jgi:cell division protein FtsN
MADYRGRVYEPSDEVHVFDASEDDEDSEGSRLPLLIVIALFVLASFGGVVWLAYEKGVASGRTEPRTIAADAGPAKVAPENQTETQTPYKGLKIYEQQAQNEGLDGTPVQNTAPVKPRAQTNSASAAPPLRAPLTDNPIATPGPTATSLPPIAPRLKPPQIERAPAAPPAQLSETVPTQEPAQGATQAPTQEPTQQAGAPPEASPATAAATGTSTGSAGTSFAPYTGVPASSAAAPGQAATEPAAVAGAAYLLQIGSYKSTAEADAAWSAFQAKHSALLGGVSPNVKAADLGDKGVWYRLRFGPFVDRDAAVAMCERVRADGGTCIVSR